MAAWQYKFHATNSFNAFHSKMCMSFIWDNSWTSAQLWVTSSHRRLVEMTLTCFVPDVAWYK